MATVRLNRQNAATGQLPPICVCCDANASTHVQHEFPYEPMHILLLLSIFPRFARYLQTVTLVVPVCSDHAHWPQKVNIFLWILLGCLLLVVAPLAVLAAVTQTDAAAIAAFGAAGLGIAAFVIGRYWFKLTHPRLVRIAGMGVELTCVSERFAQACGGQPAQQMHYGQQFPNQYAASGKGSNGGTTALIAGGVAVGVLFLCCGGGIIRLIMSAPGNRQLAAQPGPQPATPPLPYSPPTPVMIPSPAANYLPPAFPSDFSTPPVFAPTTGAAPTAASSGFNTPEADSSASTDLFGNPTEPTTPALPGEVVTTAPPASKPEQRTWSDASGKYKIEATLVSVKDGKVTLNKSDGTTVVLPIDRLSPADQEYVKQRGKGG